MSSFLRLEQVSKSFVTPSRTLRVLNELSFAVDQGELLAITGPSGIGKTTLLHLIGTLDSPDSDVH